MSGKIVKRTSPISRSTVTGGTLRDTVHLRERESSSHVCHEDPTRLLVTKEATQPPPPPPQAQTNEAKQCLEECIICTEEIKLWATYSNCGHAVCWVCALRMMANKRKRMLHRCCYCKRGSKKIFIGSRKVPPYEGKTLTTIPFRERGIHADCLDQDAFDRVLEVTVIMCKVCDRSMYDYAELTAHTRRAHGLSICDVCVKNRPLFIREHQLFTAKDLSAHISTKHRDKSEVNHGHPICYLCGKYNYDGQALLSHVQSRHVMCGLCDRNGTEWVFFKDLKTLLQHCRAKHALCEACASAGLYDRAIFSSYSELSAHERNCPTTSYFSSFRRALAPGDSRFKKHPTGLRLLMSTNGWAMERPTGWTNSKIKGPNHTSEWLSSQLRKNPATSPTSRPVRRASRPHSYGTTSTASTVSRR